MNWLAVCTRLDEIAIAKQKIATDPYRQRDEKMAAAIMAGTILAISDALLAGATPPKVLTVDGPVNAETAARLQAEMKQRFS